MILQHELNIINKYQMEQFFIDIENFIVAAGNGNWNHSIKRFNESKYSFYNIPDEKLDLFYQFYCDYAYKYKHTPAFSPENSIVACYKRPEVGPLALIGELIFNEEAEIENFLMHMMYHMQEIIASKVVYKPDVRGELRACLLFSNPLYNKEKNQYRYEFEIVFPYCVMSHDLQITEYFDEFEKRLNAFDVVQYLTGPLVESFDYIARMKELTSGESRRLYGSHPRDIQGIFDKISQDEIENSDFDGLETEYEKTYKPDCHELFTKGQPLEKFYRTNKTKKFDYWLPLLLGNTYNTAPSKFRGTKITRIRSSTADLSESNSEINSTRNSRTGRTEKKQALIDPSSEGYVDKYLDMFNDARAVDEVYAVIIGKALFNIHNGKDSGLDVWINFLTSRTVLDKNLRFRYELMYPDFAGSTYTLRTLAYFAREDSSEAFEEMNKKWIRNLQQKSLNCVHYEVAQCFYSMFWLDIICGGAKNKMWYVFDEVRGWQAAEIGILIKKKMSEEFRKSYDRFHAELSNKIAGDSAGDDEDEKDRLRCTITKIVKLTTKLGDDGYKGRLLSTLPEFFLEPKFTGRLDTNCNLLGVANGVIEIVNDNPEFRKQLPEDYVTLSGCRWDETLGPEHRKVKDCKKWIRQVFADDELCGYFLKLASSCLVGKNIDKFVVFFTGDGNNSKSMVKKLFEATFGDYSYTFPKEVITTKRNGASGVSPEMAHTRGKRVCHIQESNETDKINDGELKALTGGDTFFCRFLHNDGGNITAQFKTFVWSNGVPQMTSNGAAVKNRVLIMPCMSTWTSSDKAPESEKEQLEKKTFPADKFFENKIPGLASAFLYMLVENYKLYRREGVSKTPQIVLDHTRQYWVDNDTYSQFWEDYVEEVFEDEEGKIRDEKVFVDINNDVWPLFRSFYKEYYPNITCPSRDLMKKELVRLKGKLKTSERLSGWSGYRLRDGMEVQSF